MKIGIIGGSGLYGPAQSGDIEQAELDTPFGKPSDKFHIWHERDHTLIFLARHGAGHRLLPSEINYRANIYGLKRLGVSCVISISAVGSMRSHISPGDFVLPDQYIDMTRGIRPQTFFGGGVVAHANFASPACVTLREAIASKLESSGVKAHIGGAYVCIEGPQFSTKAESLVFRGIESIQVIGMTAMPEARLAREAGLCYQTVAMATDYDCWHESEAPVTLSEILRVLKENVSKSQNLIARLSKEGLPVCKSDCRASMQHSVVTTKDLWPADRVKELEFILS